MTPVDIAPERGETWRDETPAPAGWRPALALAAVALVVLLALMVTAGAPLMAYAVVTAALAVTAGYVAVGFLK